MHRWKLWEVTVDGLQLKGAVSISGQGTLTGDPFFYPTGWWYVDHLGSFYYVLLLLLLSFLFFADLRLNLLESEHFEQSSILTLLEFKHCSSTWIQHRVIADSVYHVDGVKFLEVKELCLGCLRNQLFWGVIIQRKWRKDVLVWTFCCWCRCCCRFFQRSSRT